MFISRNESETARSASSLLFIIIQEIHNNRLLTMVAIGVLAIVNLLLTENNESLEVLGGTGVGLGLIGAGSFAFIVSLLAFIGNAVADAKAST